jgi:hypothetical protein
VSGVFSSSYNERIMFNSLQYGKEVTRKTSEKKAEAEFLDVIGTKVLKVHKIEIFFGFDFEICIISLLVMSKY